MASQSSPTSAATAVDPHLTYYFPVSGADTAETVLAFPSAELARECADERFVATCYTMPNPRKPQTVVESMKDEQFYRHLKRSLEAEIENMPPAKKPKAEPPKDPLAVLPLDKLPPIWTESDLARGYRKDASWVKAPKSLYESPSVNSHVTPPACAAETQPLQQKAPVAHHSPYAFMGSPRVDDHVRSTNSKSQLSTPAAGQGPASAQWRTCPAPQSSAGANGLSHPRNRTQTPTPMMMSSPSPQLPASEAVHTPQWRRQAAQTNVFRIQQPQQVYHLPQSMGHQPIRPSQSMLQPYSMQGAQFSGVQSTFQRHEMNSSQPIPQHSPYPTPIPAAQQQIQPSRSLAMHPVNAETLRSMRYQQRPPRQPPILAARPVQPARSVPQASHMPGARTPGMGIGPRHLQREYQQNTNMKAPVHRDPVQPLQSPTSTPTYTRMTQEETKFTADLQRREAELKLKMAEVVALKKEYDRLKVSPPRAPGKPEHGHNTTPLTSHHSQTSGSSRSYHSQSSGSSGSYHPQTSGSGSQRSPCHHGSSLTIDTTARLQHCTQLLQQASPSRQGHRLHLNPYDQFANNIPQTISLQDAMQSGRPLYNAMAMAFHRENAVLKAPMVTPPRPAAEQQRDNLRVSRHGQRHPGFIPGKFAASQPTPHMIGLSNAVKALPSFEVKSGYRLPERGALRDFEYQNEQYFNKHSGCIFKKGDFKDWFGNNALFDDATWQYLTHWNKEIKEWYFPSK